MEKIKELSIDEGLSQKDIQIENKMNEMIAAINKIMEDVKNMKEKLHKQAFPKG
ncbi:hypothetical protein KAS79_01180 [Candidatus Parcubacteria bacterium]|nr:hypothetical protein [Candidatus Parcubacteria bacterium]